MQVATPVRNHACFGPFDADLTSHELRFDGNKIKLQEMPFQVLAILLERPGELVTREEFRRRLWPSDTFVDFEHSINTAVKKLREALADNPEAPRYIETLPKKGYRFIAPVSEPPARAESVVTQVLGIDVLSRAIPHRPKRLRRYLALVGALLLVVALPLGLNLGGVRDWLSRMVSSRHGLPLQINALAVLPLQNLSQDPDQAYFADGLTDALITDLGKVSGLRVISHTSAISYKKSGKSLPEIARELDVDAIVEGTVLRSGNRVRITVQLVRAVPEAHLWAERYERAVTEVIPLEQQLAVEIAHEVSGRLITAEETRLGGRRTINPQAYDAYLRGRYLWKQRTTESITQARRYFEEALRQDPNFALAYSGLADCYSVGWGAEQDMPRAETYARKALALDPELAEGYISLAYSEIWQRKLSDAGKHLQRGIELNPNYVMAHQFYAIYLLAVGRPTEALAENDRALQLDPFSFPVNNLRAVILYSLSQFEASTRQFEITASINPQSAPPHGSLTRNYWAQQRALDAMAEERKFATLAQYSARLRDGQEVTATYAKYGFDAARRKYAEFREADCRLRPLDCDAWDTTVYFAALQDREKTLEWLDHGFQARDSNMLLEMKTAPELDFLRSDPRFRELVHRMGLPE